ncbi:hypothetical protein [Amycolatopsis albispora]|uniref:Uncharacterized protein n=1 Tax=Amycolatopsis albispora TaxID=1804986 RepID=A0A344L759_9PSEU|nr:hypothetical protein [Amycolatopsis albispora]AXB43883.1 hypothetical protein A4R43_16255 [Amycolatopsis albispora]
MTVGATPPPPAMPPQFQPHHQPPPPPPRRPGVHGFSVAAGVLALVAAGLLIFGSFLPYTEYLIVHDGEQSFSQQTTGWEWIMDESGDNDVASASFAEPEGAHPPRFGIVLTVAAAILLIGAFVTVASAGRGANPGVRAGSRLMLSTATAGAVVAVWMVALTATSLESMAVTDEVGRGSFRTVYHLETGLWVLICGGGVALLALVVAWLPAAGSRAVAGPPPGPGVQMFVEPRTPPHGFAPPVPPMSPPPAPPPPPAVPPAPEPYISPFTQAAATESLDAKPAAEAEAGKTEEKTEEKKDEEPPK